MYAEVSGVLISSNTAVFVLNLSVSSNLFVYRASEYHPSNAYPVLDGVFNSSVVYSESYSFVISCVLSYRSSLILSTYISPVPSQHPYTYKLGFIVLT